MKTTAGGWRSVGLKSKDGLTEKVHLISYVVYGERPIRIPPQAFIGCVEVKLIPLTLAPMTLRICPIRAYFIPSIDPLCCQLCPFTSIEPFWLIHVNLSLIGLGCSHQYHSNSFCYFSEIFETYLLAYVLLVVAHIDDRLSNRVIGQGTRREKDKTCVCVCELVCRDASSACMLRASPKNIV